MSKRLSWFIDPLETPMKRTFQAHLLLVPIVALLAATVPAHATPTYAGIPATASGRFGGRAAVDLWAKDLNTYVQGDIRINHIFSFGGDRARQKAWQADVVKMVLNSPVDQTQADAIAAKYKLALTRTQYNAVVDNIYRACSASRTPYHVCNRFVVALAPFARAVATR